MIKVIKTEADYEAALSALESLIDRDPDPGTPDADRLELLTVLLEDYEKKNVALEAPDPIEAIRFRMEQQGLTNKDLIPYIGSRSKVSEVLSGKRALTLAMIRALHTGLGIPANVLVSESETTPEEDVDWEKFPIQEMAKRGWISLSASATDLRSAARGALDDFFAPVGAPARFAVLYRKTAHVRSGRTMDRFALAAWTARIMRRALEAPPTCSYSPGVVTPEFMKSVVRFSTLPDGPRRACDFLGDHGIPVVIEPQLPRTSLDGGAVLLDVGRPVIGLTLRHDRLDNFWFCLMHELAHVALHLSGAETGQDQFFDDLDVSSSTDPKEIEADTTAGEALIPETAWRTSPASKVRAVPAVLHLAHQLQIHPAIVAGRIRHQHKDYRVLGALVGQGEVRRLFPDVAWA